MLIRQTRRFFAAGMTLICSQTAFAIGVGEIAVLDPKGLSDSEVIALLASIE